MHLLGASTGPAVVSILVSKNAGRYRIQADSYPALLMVLEELERRLNARILPPTTSQQQGGGGLLGANNRYYLTHFFAVCY